MSRDLLSGDGKAQDKLNELLFACCSNGGSVEEIAALLDKGANVNAQDESRRPPLELAALNNDLKACTLLLDRGAKEVVGTKVTSPLHSAANCGYTWVSRLLIERGFDVNRGEAQGCSPLRYAMNGGHHWVSLLLVASGARAPKEEGLSQCGKELIEICRLTPLQASVRYGDGRLLLNLLDRLGHSESVRESALEAAEIGEGIDKSEITRQLAAQGAAVARAWVSASRVREAMAEIESAGSASVGLSRSGLKGST